MKHTIKLGVRSLWKRIPAGLRLRVVRIIQHKFTASAACVIVNGRGQVLLLDHVLRPYSGWGLPGGFIEHGESPADAVRREINEEVGLELDDLRSLRTRIVGRHIEFLFAASSDGEPAIRSDEILAVRWFDADSLPEKMSNAQKDIVKQVLSGRV
jgi:ADP-ribose pyrophosphatase YjhB (NUDIX family)